MTDLQPLAHQGDRSFFAVSLDELTSQFFSFAKTVAVFLRSHAPSANGVLPCADTTVPVELFRSSGLSNVYQRISAATNAADFCGIQDSSPRPRLGNSVLSSAGPLLAEIIPYVVDVPSC